MADKHKIIVGTSKSLSYLASPTVKVVVGEGAEGRTFYVHSNLLISRSVFFAKALRTYVNTAESRSNGQAITRDQSIQWREGEEGIVNLPADDPDAFAAYVQLIYSGALPIDDTPKEIASSQEDVTEEEELEVSEGTCIDAAISRLYYLLSKLYGLCEKIRDVKGKRTLLAAFVEASSVRRGDGYCHYPGTVTTIRHIYAHTLSRDPLRSFVVDCYTYEGNETWAHAEHDVYSPEFLYDVMAKFLKLRGAPKGKSPVEDAEYYLRKLEEQENGNTAAGIGGETTSDGE